MKALPAVIAVLAALSFASVASAEGCPSKEKRVENPPPTVGS